MNTEDTLPPNNRKRGLSVARIIAASVLLILCLVWVFFRIFYCAHVDEHELLPFPENLNNATAKAMVEMDDVPHEDGFSFVLVGDVNAGMETFENILEKVKTEKHIQFLMLLGDCVSSDSRGKHQYFQGEFVETGVKWPTFVIAGNNDIGSQFTMNDFEKEYGPANFYFEFQSNLFIGLGTIVDENDPKRDNAYEFVKWVLETRRDRNKHVFVFSHYFPGTPAGVPSVPFEDSERFIKLYEKWKVNYAISGHFHRYITSENNGVEYIVSGGGGGSLDSKISVQQGYDDVGRFHHAIIFRVKGDSIAERVLMVESAGFLATKLEDMERICLVDIFPFVKKHPWVSYVADGLFVVLLGISAYLFFGRKRERVTV